MGKRAILVLPVRVHHGHCGGQGLAAQMVVQDDDVGQAVGGGQRLVGQGAAIDAYDQIVVAGQGGDSGCVGAISFVDAVWDIGCGHPPQTA